MDKTNKLELFLAEKQKKIEEKKIVMFSDKVYEFDSVKDASEKLKIDFPTISQNIYNKSRFVYDNSGLKIKFMKKSEYDKLSKEEVDSILAEIDERKLVILNTGQEFNSARELSNYLNTCQNNILIHVKGKSKSCGKINGEKCVIRYKRDYIKLSENEIIDLIRNANSKVKRKDRILNKDVVVLFNTGEIFNDRKEIFSKYGITKSTLSCGLNRSKTHIGGYDGNIPLIWFYGKDYNSLTEEDIKYFNQAIKENTKQNIVLYNNGKIYSRDFIVNTLNISLSRLNACLRGEYKSAGKCKGYPLIWVNEDKYTFMSEEDKEELDKYIKDNSTRYYFVNENKEFYNINQFSKDYNISSSSIRNCLHKKFKSAKWKEDERAIFVYLDEFNNMSEEERKKFLAESETERYKNYTDNTPKPVKSYTEGIEFDSRKEASEYYGIDGRKLFKSIKNNEWITDENNKPLKFEDIEKEEKEE